MSLSQKEKYILQCVKDSAHNTRRLRECEERLLAQSYKITPSYSESGGSGSREVHSKVESYAIRQVRDLEQIAEYKKKLKIAEKARFCPTLNYREKAALDWIACGGTVAGYAEAWGIYKSYAYKIRDKAIKKAHKHITELGLG